MKPTSSPPHPPGGRWPAGWLALALSLALGLAGCASGPPVDTRYTSQNQDSRVLFLIIHYTVGDFSSSLQALTVGEVSSHYLVDDRTDDFTIYRLVDERRRAWHAGVSCWKNNCGLNASSVGIEIVNPGMRDGVFVPFPPGQIDRVLALSRDIIERHQIRAERVLGHNEISPGWKEDPGPLFPWKRLADEGLIAWPSDAEIAAARHRLSEVLPPVAWFQEQLATHGIQVPRSGVLDEGTRRALMMFQMRYRPALYAGDPDLETAALLGAVTTDSYRKRAYETPDQRRTRLAREAAP